MVLVLQDRWLSVSFTGTFDGLPNVVLDTEGLLMFLGSYVGFPD